MGRKFGTSFSWRRASGLSAAKGRISRKVGIPLTRSGRQKKLGRMVGRGCGCGCLSVVVVVIGLVGMTTAVVTVVVVGRDRKMPKDQVAMMADGEKGSR